MTRSRSRRASVAASCAAAAAAWALGSCAPSLDAGHWGTFRFIGHVKGDTPPLAVLPPISDRSGNIYTLYGDVALPEVLAFVSRAAGGSLEACNLTHSDIYGAHAWIGFSDDRAWYWSGDALVEVAATRPCSRVLAIDPQTNVEIVFRAVMPWVRVESTRASAVALIQSVSDKLPFAALVDLDRGIATNVAQVPIDADGVAILGVGARQAGTDRVTLVAKNGGGTSSMLALWFDESASLVATVPVAGPPPPEYGIRGTLQFGSGDRVVGLTNLGTLVSFDRSGGTVIPIDASITPVGVHGWNGDLWLVGTVNGKTVVSKLDDAGRPGPPTPWSASDAAGAGLAGTVNVLDDRAFPARDAAWQNVHSAIGPAPFLSAHSPWPHAPGTTLWVVTGPTAGGQGRPTTSIAIAPVGLTYP